MIITPRTREIVLLLIDHLNSYLSVNEIAEYLNVTDRTIYRQLSEVYEVVESCDLTIDNVSGYGMKLSGAREKINELISLIESNNQVFELSTEDRINVIIFYLIHEKDYVKAQYFSEMLRVSVQSIRNDLTQIKSKLSSFDLELVIKKGDGFLIEGLEIKKRVLLSNIFRDNVSFVELVQWIEYKKDNSIYFQMLSDLNYHPIIKKSFTILDKLFRKHGFQVPDTTFQDYFFLISIMIKRLGWDLSSNYYLENIVNNKETAIQLYEDLKESLENEFNIQLNQSERSYLQWLISINNNFQHTNLSDESSIVGLANKVNDFIVFVETGMGCRLRTDTNLQKSLFEHLERALARTRSGITITNPMLKEIRRSYDKLYSTIKIAVNQVFEHDHFPEEEIGFLVLHFAVALDKVLDKSIKALVVCSSGMGSSKMLANRLIREMPEIEVKKVVSFMQLTTEDLGNYDIVFSTVSLPLEAKEYVMVSPLLNSKELIEVKSILRRIRFSKLHGKELLVPKKTLDFKELPRELYEISLIAKYGSDLLKNFHKVDIEPKSNQFPVLEFIGEYLKKQGYTEDSSLLTNCAEEANLDSYFGIPNTKLGYIHCRTDEVTMPLFMVFDFQKNIVFSSLEKELMEVTSVILMISPKRDKEIIADLLSMITRLIIESPESIKLFEHCKEEQLRNLLGERIKDYVAEKIL